MLVRKEIHLTKDDLMAMFEYRDGALAWKNKNKDNNYGAKVGAIQLNGYRVVCIEGVTYRAHRLIFKMFHDQEPDYIDHINQTKSDDRIENLREITNSQNCHNRGAPINNTSGIKGVSWYRSTSKWRVRMVANNNIIHLGYTEDYFEACCRRKSAEIKYFPEIYCSNGS